LNLNWIIDKSAKTYISQRRTAETALKTHLSIPPEFIGKRLRVLNRALSHAFAQPAQPAQSCSELLIVLKLTQGLLKAIKIIINGFQPH